MVTPSTPSPLPTLLSNALIAFTIEFDNEFERQLVGSGRPPVFLVSLAMWSNYMRFVRDEGVRVGELAILARDSEAAIKSRLAGLERWGYVVVAPDPTDQRPKPPRRDWIVRPTANGRRAQEHWDPLLDVIEQRWRERFGEDEIGNVRERLGTILGRLDRDLPQYLPVVTAGRQMFSEVTPRQERSAPSDDGGAESPLPLSALLAQVLLAFTLEFERDSDLSLPVCANVVRVLERTGQRVGDLPRLSGVSKEAISMVVGSLEKTGCAVVEPDPTANRGRIVRLTTKGEEKRDAYRRLLEVVEERWQARFGEDHLRALRESLENLVGGPDLALSPLSAGLVPHPGGWRASVRPPDVLPHHPMVLHRGGWPDGS